MSIPWEEIWNKTGEHLWLTSVSLFLAVIFSIPAGIIISKNKKLSGPFLSVINAIQTIPSLALLGFLIPLLGIGTVPAIVALFLYAMLPIVRNTFAGINDIEPNVLEAARGMGMTNNQLLFQVELPLALKIIFAGIRTAFVINVGVATLCSLIGAGGLGDFIFRGISLNNSELILYGAIPASLLALFGDGILGVLQSKINFRNSRTWFIAIVSVFFVISISAILNTKRDSKNWKAALSSEFIYREDGYIGLKKTYDLDWEIIEMDVTLSYKALSDKDADVISAFSTDGRIKAYDLFVLEDDKNFFPPYYAAPLVRNETLQNNPELIEILNKLEGRINDSIMTELNFMADEGGQLPKQVAMNFLSSEGFSTGIYNDSGSDIIIGSKNFTESFILSEMFKILIENYSNLSVEVKPAFGGTKLIFDALRFGEIDLYPEYTGTGYLVLLPEDERSEQLQYNKDAIYELVSVKFDSLYDLRWLQPIGFNNTHAIAIRKQVAEDLKLKKVSDLPRYRK